MISVFVFLKTKTDWLRLERSKRNEIADSVFAQMFKDNNISVRLFDAEAFTSKCTDIALFQMEDIKEYYFAIERLRDSVLITHPYFEIVEIIPSIENGFKLFEKNEKN